MINKEEFSDLKDQYKELGEFAKNVPVCKNTNDYSEVRNYSINTEKFLKDIKIKQRVFQSNFNKAIKKCKSPEEENQLIEYVIHGKG